MEKNVTMMVKPEILSNIVSKKSLRKVQKKTMQIIADALRMTYGPLGSNSWLITGNDKASLKNEFSKDGRTVLKKILFLEPIEMAIQSEIEEIALYTDREVGDGTTSATLLSNAVFQRFYDYEEKLGIKYYYWDDEYIEYFRVNNLLVTIYNYAFFVESEEDEDVDKVLEYIDKAVS